MATNPDEITPVSLPRLNGRINELRIPHDVLASVTGMSADSLKSVMAGTRLPKRSEVVSLASVLNGTVGYFLGEPVPDVPPPAIAPPIRNPADAVQPPPAPEAAEPAPDATVSNLIEALEIEAASDWISTPDGNLKRIAVRDRPPKHDPGPLMYDSSDMGPAAVAMAKMVKTTMEKYDKSCDAIEAGLEDVRLPARLIRFGIEYQIRIAVLIEINEVAKTIPAATVPDDEDGWGRLYSACIPLATYIIMSSARTETATRSEL
jgi:hypothetical protein